MRKKVIIGIFSLVSVFMLSACAANQDEKNHENMDMDKESSSKESMDMSHNELTTFYMIDYIPTTGREKVTNHKWVTESELSVK